MPAPSEFGFWVNETTSLPPVPGQVWPGGYFESVDEWDLAFMQVFSGVSISSTASAWYQIYHGFQTTVFGAPPAVDINSFLSNRVSVGSACFIDGQPIPIIGYPVSLDFWLNGFYTYFINKQPAGTLPIWQDAGRIMPGPNIEFHQVWNRVGLQPFTITISDDVVLLQQQHFNPHIKNFPAGPTESKSLILSIKDAGVAVYPNAKNTSIKGPYVSSKKYVPVNAGQSIEIWWRAKGGHTSNFLLTIYLLDENSGQATILLDIGKPDRQTIGQASDNNKKIQVIYWNNSLTGKKQDSRAIQDECNSRKLNEVEFTCTTTKISKSGNYKLIIVHGGNGEFRNFQSDPITKRYTVPVEATSEIAAIRIV